MHSWAYHPLYWLYNRLNEGIRMSIGAIDVMFENSFVRYILYSITEIPFIMLGYLTAQVTMLRSSGFVKFLEKLFWESIFGPIWELLLATITAIEGYFESSSVRWVRGKIWEAVMWLREVTATEWLTFLAAVVFWPVILVAYIVQSIISLFKMTDPALSAIIDPLLSLMSLISPEDIDSSKVTTY